MCVLALSSSSCTVLRADEILAYHAAGAVHFRVASPFAQPFGQLCAQGSDSQLAAGLSLNHFRCSREAAAGARSESVGSLGKSRRLYTHSHLFFHSILECMWWLRRFEEANASLSHLILNL